MTGKGTVCVTGAGGFVGSWVVKLLLSHGYTVHGTVRRPEDAKYSHLKKLENAAENLNLLKADLLDYESLCAAIKGCAGVFHVASPVPSTAVPNPEVVLLEPAVSGTLNVLKAASQANVRRVVVVSSGASVSLNPHWPKRKVMDENCWSDKDYCRETKNWYCLSKTEAEIAALEYGKRSGLDVVAVCPTLVLGPMLQSVLNASNLVLVKLLKEGLESLENKQRLVVDVRDVAQALLLVFQKPEAQGRYICMAHAIKSRQLVDKLRSIFPSYNYPKMFTDSGGEDESMSSERLQNLGWTYRPLEETLIDSVQSYDAGGHLA